MNTPSRPDQPNDRRPRRRAYPNAQRSVDLSHIPPTPKSTNGPLCAPERIVPGLRKLPPTSPRQQRLLEGETLAHFALSAGKTEAQLVTPVALALSEGEALLLRRGLREDLRLVALQELAHEQRYGSDVVEFVRSELGYDPAALGIELSPDEPGTPPTRADIARYVVAEATASGTLYGDHGDLCAYADELFSGHRADELIHNQVALRVNELAIIQSSGESLREYLHALREAIISACKPSTAWVKEVVRRLGYRGADAGQLVADIVQDEANTAAVVVSCAALYRNLREQLSEAQWETFIEALPERLQPGV